jgi:CDGSH-type Zn-finger protein
MDSFTEDKSAACVITLKARGPVAITGDFVIIDEDGNELPKKEKISICRCGMSKILPICDGAHKGLSF